ncbi:MAG: 2,3-bisphosphoglycerate-independent phosphoglycerate mutase [Coriobacteriales bacterium]|nr:2,3-bisphosphoglycerate-independent phosphoglycerate mutase [Coriobacteriales bacterium]
MNERNEFKYAVVILDGAAGLPVVKCKDCKQTTLEAANTPNMDALALHGLCGITKNVPDGFGASSNIACTSIMGYDPSLYPIGRGAIEAASCGVDLDHGEIAMRMNLCHVADDGTMLSYSCENIENESAHKIIDELSSLNDEHFTIYKSVGFRSIIKVRGLAGLLNAKYHAAHDITDQNINDKMPSGDEDVDVLIDYMKRCNNLLANCAENNARADAGLARVNQVWPFWPGVKPNGMPSFFDSYGLKAAMQSPVDLLNGLAKLTNMRVYTFDGISDGRDNDYNACGQGAIEMLKENDIVFIHIENPDSEGHDGSIEGKIFAIEQIDKFIIGPIWNWAQMQDFNFRIAFLPDHYTPIALKTHSSEPVPFVICGDGIESTAGARLTEKEGAKSGIQFDAGYKMMKTLLKK